MPILIYSSVKRGITPDINALSTLIVLASVIGTIGVACCSVPANLQEDSHVQATDAVLAVSLLCTASAWAQKNKLNLFIWSEYIDPKIIENFEKEYDCKVTVDLYEDNESMMAKLEGGGDSLYDICVPSDYIIPALIKNGLLAPLRHENIPNIKNIDPKFGNREYDPGNKYTAPYQWGTVGIYVRKKPGEKIDETWGLMFDPKKSIGSFLMMDDTRAMHRRRAQVQGLQPQHDRQEANARKRATCCSTPRNVRSASRAASASRTRCSPRSARSAWSTTATPFAA